MEQSPSWESISSSAGQEIPYLLWNPNVHYRVHKSKPLVRQMKKGHNNELVEKNVEGRGRNLF
jgi:hypothetical protein